MRPLQLGTIRLNADGLTTMNGPWVVNGVVIDIPAYPHPVFVPFEVDIEQINARTAKILRDYHTLGSTLDVVLDGGPKRVTAVLITARHLTETVMELQRALFVALGFINTSNGQLIP